METEKVEKFLTKNAKRYPVESYCIVKGKLLSLTKEQEKELYELPVRSPTAMVFVAIFLGMLGIDRFILGDVGLGILKLLTRGCFGILLLIDIFTVYTRTKEKNLQDLLNFFNTKK